MTKALHIGLVGGIGPAATDYYYRKLIKAFADASIALDLTIVHADTPTLLTNQRTNAQAAQIDIYNRLTDRLAAAGANCVAITSIAGHFCINPFKEHSRLPVIDMLVEVDRDIDRRGLRRVGIIGTRTVMETRFYGALKTAHCVAPQGDLLSQVHEAYVAMASSGRVTPDQVAVFDTACQEMLQSLEAEAILLGGTDLALVYTEETSAFPVIDCAETHIKAIFDFAIKSEA